MEEGSNLETKSIQSFPRLSLVLERNTMRSTPMNVGIKMKNAIMSGKRTRATYPCVLR